MCMAIRKPRRNESQPDDTEHTDKELRRMQRLIKAIIRIYERKDTTPGDEIIEYKEEYPQVVQWGEDMVAQIQEEQDDDRENPSQ